MTRTRKFEVAALGAAASLALLAVPAAAVPTGHDEDRSQQQDFSIVVLPDTQYNSKYFPQVWDSTGKWIAEESESRDIAYALHVGDVVHDSDDGTQWQRAVNGMDYLQDAVPSIIGVGNHDMEDAEKSRDATTFNEHFPRSKFADLPSFGDTHPGDQNDNSFHTFSAGGTDWLVLALKYEPTDAEIEWGNQVIAEHPDHQTMIVTHSYQKGDDRTEVGDDIWEKLVSKHENVSFVFSGHHRDAGMLESEGEQGNTVYQIQADYQNPDELDPNSYLRYMRFSPSDQTVKVYTYSPHLDENMTDEKNQFTINDVEFLPAGG